MHDKNFDLYFHSDRYSTNNTQFKNDNINRYTLPSNFVVSNCFNRENSNINLNIIKSNYNKSQRFHSLENDEVNTVKKLDSEEKLLNNDNSVQSNKIFQTNNKEIYFSKRK